MNITGLLFAEYGHDGDDKVGVSFLGNEEYESFGNRELFLDFIDSEGYSKMIWDDLYNEIWVKERSEDEKK